MTIALTKKSPTPKQLTDYFIKKLHVSAPPPDTQTYFSDLPSTIRAVAEYEPMGGVVIAYPGTVAPKEPQLPPVGPRAFGIPDELIIRMQQLENDKPVHIFIMGNVSDLEKQQVLENLEESAGALRLKFDRNLCHFVPWDTDTFWTRDYAPWWVQNKTDKNFSIAKHIYTSLGGGSAGMVEGNEEGDPRTRGGIFRPNDDYGAVKFSDYLNAPIRQWNNAWEAWHKIDPSIQKIPPHGWYFTGLLDVGGNYMVTGDGVISSSYLVATQNELPGEEKMDDREKIANRMEYIMRQANLFLGASTYHVFTDPSGTYIGHIDCWGKFLADNKVLIARSDVEAIDRHFDTIAAYLQERNFQVYRVMCQHLYIPHQDEPLTTAAYTNSLVLNNYVYVPIAGGQYTKNDDDALAIYQEALPTHTVIGIPGKPEFPWLGTDAMHCRTRGVPREVVDHWLASQLLSPP